MPDYIVEAKALTITRCIARAREEHGLASDFATDFTHQDAAVLNVLRACEAAIDIGARLARLRRLPPPEGAADIFRALARHGLFDAAFGERMVAMVGFRNRAVHDYPGLDIETVERVVLAHLKDLQQLCALALADS